MRNDRNVDGEASDRHRALLRRVRRETTEGPRRNRPVKSLEMTSHINEPGPIPRRIHDSRMGVDLGQELDLLCLGQRWTESGHNAKTIIERDELSVILITMRAASRIVEHHAKASVALHTLSGSVRVTIAERAAVILSRGHILAMKREVAHEIEAIEDSTLLLSIARRREKTG